MIFRLPAAACIGVLLLLPSSLPAQEPAAPSAMATVAPLAFSYELGHSANSRAEAGTTYLVRAAQPLDSKLVGQKSSWNATGPAPASPRIRP